MLSRVPASRLRPFVRTLWASLDGGKGVERERVLPTGLVHIVLRLAGPPLRVYRGVGDLVGEQAGSSLIGGPRETFYVRDVSQPSASVGAQFEAGAAELLIGVPAHEFAGRHTCLEDVWGHCHVNELRERLLAAPTQAHQLLIFEQALIARLPRFSDMHPAIAQAMERLQECEDISALAVSAGLSHRHFIALFTRAVGIGPKRYSRLLRFQKTVTALAATNRSLVDVAIDGGYTDQSHFTREFKAFSGLTPGAYRQEKLEAPNHVPIPKVNFVQDEERSSAKTTDHEDS